ncbi:hypothetical protein BYT27DRAFT_6824302 [Phlegmacium glaucopus]|nr:hypothetical protein BYT27DRAFT_6824302 [Phlegmacium glaucopus]
MNPSKFTTLLSVLIGSVSSLVVPGADTLSFYLISSSSSTYANLLPLRIKGGSGGYASLTGSRAILFLPRPPCHFRPRWYNFYLLTSDKSSASINGVYHLW